MIILAVLYFLLPYDLIPDGIGRFGRIDDVALLLIIIYWLFIKPLVDEVYAKARAAGQGSYASDSQIPTDPYKVLGIDPKATQEEIKKAYYELMKQYHPDRVNNLGPELKTLASQKTTQINQAYEQLTK